MRYHTMDLIDVLREPPALLLVAGDLVQVDLLGLLGLEETLRWARMPFEGIFCTSQTPDPSPRRNEQRFRGDLRHCKKASCHHAPS